MDSNVLKVFDVKNSMNAKKSHGGTSVINVKLFNMWIMCPRIIANYSTDGYHIQINRLPLNIYEKRLTLK